MKILMTKEFQKNLSKMVKRGHSKEEIDEVINSIIDDSLEPKHKDHKWKTSFKGDDNLRECHIKPDWILLYKKEKDCLYLKKTGTHSDFKIGS